jgi:hypothetical protein
VCIKRGMCWKLCAGKLKQRSRQCTSCSYFPDGVPLSRRERITLQDINFAGPDKDIYNVRLLSDALPDFDTPGEAGMVNALHSCAL